MPAIRPFLALTLLVALLSGCASQAPVADTPTAPADTAPAPRKAIADYDWQPVLDALNADAGTDRFHSQIGTDNTLQLTLQDDVAFASGSPTPTARFTAMLDRLGDILQQRHGLVVRIVGHTDSTGREGYNMQLSRARAKAVRTALIDRSGVAPARLDAEGRGESEPVADNDTAEGRARNRRVELFLTPLP
ncbi:OmpA family protein [Denitromonas iodatirespirans]|uniref:OmpA family protein n=1 Tax=Denitromonas iodatirespirans TaxID=2795389 RepID=A0A944DCV9_DENI1|nr:OmpA family protein [Denitromonas iodatirespirans]MBT0962012.1 OmpA family protein [Denitromonas iodatirespirans]